MSSLGLTPAGFVLPRQADIRAALEASFRAQFGATVNLSSETVFGQLIGIMSEREALWWEGLEDDVLSATPAGAEGVYVDNLLAYAGLERLPAAPTVTNPTASAADDGKVLYGLVCYGTPGTVIPAGAIVQTSTEPTYSFTLDAPVTIGQAQNAVQRIYFAAAASSGTYALSLECPSGAVATTSPLPFNVLPQATQLAFAKAPSSGSYTLTLGTERTDPLPFSAQAADIQAALQALPGYGSVGVTGSAANGFVIAWPVGPIPQVGLSSTTDTQLRVIDSVQASINALTDVGTGLRPFTDAAVTSDVSGQLTVTFGANAPAQNQPSSAAAAQGLIVVASNSLMAGTTAISMAVGTAVMGHPAQAVAQATCTETGPRQLPAGTLTVIGSTQSGWTGVTNQLDGLPGQNLETDAQAIARREGQLASKGNGPLASIVQQVQQLPGVTAAIGFENLTSAALQRLTFATVPTSGSYTLGFGASSTQAIPYAATSGDVQLALAKLPGLAAMQVSGSYSYGFTLDPAGSNGGQALPLIAVLQDTTGAQLTASFGRPPKSVEIVVEGGEDVAIAQAILRSVSAGIATYGSPVLRTTGSALAGSTTLTLASVSGLEPGLAIFMPGLRPNSTVVAVSGTSVTVSLPALSTVTNAPVIVDHTSFVRDVAGNYQQVAFSRPQQLLIYTVIELTTDYFLLPGDPNSGRNPAAAFDPASLATIQQGVIDTGNAVGIGGLLTLRGTSGLGSAFRDVPGVLDAQVYFDTVASPTNQASIRLAAEQVPLFNSFSTTVKYS